MHNCQRGISSTYSPFPFLILVQHLLPYLTSHTHATPSPSLSRISSACSHSSLQVLKKRLHVKGFVSIHTVSDKPYDAFEQIKKQAMSSDMENIVVFCAIESLAATQPYLLVCSPLLSPLVSPPLTSRFSKDINLCIRGIARTWQRCSWGKYTHLFFSTHIFSVSRKQIYNHKHKNDNINIILIYMI